MPDQEHQLTEWQRKKLVGILSSFETRSNHDIQTLMRIAFDAGAKRKFESFEEFFAHVITQVLEL